MRKEKFAGYYTAQEVMNALAISEGTLYSYVRTGSLIRHNPPGKKYGLYTIENVERLAAERQAFINADSVFRAADQDEEKPLSGEAIFTPATLADMDALYAMAVKLFPKTASGEIRRSWLRKESRGHYIVKRIADGAVMAYLYLLPLIPDRLADYLHGDLPSRKITPDDIEGFTPGIPTSACVFGGIGSDPDIEEELRTAYVAMLLRGVRKDMGRMGREGIIIPKIYAFSETNEGIAMCARLGMQQWEPPRGKWCTFVLDVNTGDAKITRDYTVGLAQWRRQHTTPTHKAISRPSQRHKSAPATSTQQPAGTITLQELAKEIGKSRSTLLDWLRNPDNGLEHIAIPNPARPKEHERFFTSDQAQAVKSFAQGKRRS